jgi:hypothetical protein
VQVHWSLVVVPPPDRGQTGRQGAELRKRAGREFLSAWSGKAHTIKTGKNLGNRA